MADLQRLTVHADDGPQAPSGLPRHQAKWMMALARIPSRSVAVACLAPLISGGLLVVQAWWLARILAGVVVHATPLAEWGAALAWIAILILIRAGLSYVGERAGAQASEHIKLALRRALFAQLVQRGPHWSRGKVSGELAAGLLEQVEALDGFFAKYLPAMVAAAILPIAFASALMPADVVAGLLLLVTAPLIPLFMALVGWGAQAASRRHMRAMGRLSGFFADRIRGGATLKMFRREQAETRAVADAAEGLRTRSMAVLRIAFLSSAVLEFFAALGVAGMAVYFGLSFLDFINLRGAPLTLDIALFCLIMAPEAYAPLRQFAAHYHDRATAQGAVAALALAFDTLPAMASKPAGCATATSIQKPVAGDAAGERQAAAFDVRHLSAVSAGSNDVLISGIDLQVPHGARLAIMGASGAGKTTLLNALARLQPASGQIRFLGEALTGWNETSLREQLAYIGQRPYLFEGTIADNIRIGAPQASEEQLQRAAELACVTDFTDAMPQQLNTSLGARGLGLSGGQAQRVALARLYLRNPSVILLDEPTAHLDDTTQRAVMQDVLAFAAGRTLVIATHAPAVAALCDSCVIMRDGRLQASDRVPDISPC